MWVRKAIQCVLFAVVAAVAVAEPPLYGPPEFLTGFNQLAFAGSRGGYQTSSPQYQTGFSHGGYQSGGFHGGYETSAPQPFSFQYDVNDPHSGNDFGHRATSDGRRVQGEYHVLLPDGRKQIVKYTADDNGYRADVQYEGQASHGYQGHQGGYQSGGYQHGGYKSGFQQGGYRTGGSQYRGGFSGYTY